MQTITLSIVNELSALPVLQATAGAYCLAVGAGQSFARQTELVLEEIITNIIKFEYLAGHKEQIELELASEDGQLALTISFRGIPFDVAFLQQCEQVCLDQIVSGEAKGIGLHLVRQFSDQVRYCNLGKQGQQITILRTLPLPDTGLAQQQPALQEPEPANVPIKPLVRRMLPQDAAAVSKLAYFAYDYSYVYEHIYDPEQVRRLNAEETLISFVAFDPAQDEVVGHCALVPDQRSGLFELGVAFVNPRFRGGGCLNELSEALISEARQRAAVGVFGMAVTDHPYSQKAAGRYGLQETALLVSRFHPITMLALHEQAMARESVLFMVRLFDAAAPRTYYAPAHHQAMLQKICEQSALQVVWAKADEAVLPDKARLSQACDHYQSGHIHVEQFGQDFLPQLKRIVRSWCLDRLESIYLYLPLQQPATALLTGPCEELGFFFAGLQPGSDGNDQLLLQYLNNQRIDYTALAGATPFGRELIAYVGSCDPDRVVAASAVSDC